MTYSPSSPKFYRSNRAPEVTLTFWKIKGKYYLRRKEADNIEDGKNLRLQEKALVTDQSAYDKLNVGNLMTVKVGILIRVSSSNWAYLNPIILMFLVADRQT